MKTILLLLLFLISTNIYAKRAYKELLIENNNYVFNLTNVYYLDTIVHAGLIYLDINNVIVTIRPITDDNLRDYVAYIQNSENQYIIWINESNSDILKILSHELIHLKQYNNKDLIIVEEYAIWKNDIYYIDYTEYEDRPWEYESYIGENKLKNEIIKMIYL